VSDGEVDTVSPFFPFTLRDSLFVDESEVRVTVDVLGFSERVRFGSYFSGFF